MEISTALTSDFIELRVLRQGDFTKDYLDWLHDPEVNKYLETRFTPPKSMSELSDFVESVNSSDHSLMLGIFLRTKNKHIGNIKLGPIDPFHNFAEIGLLIGDKDQWGKGYASIAISLVTKYAFDMLNLAKLTAGAYATNQGSIKAFLRAGYSLEGRRISQWQVGNERQDGILLGKVNTEFQL